MSITGTASGGANWTNRQRRYASLLNAEVFTPALVVNGARVVIGSDRDAVEAAISTAMSPSIQVELQRSEQGVVARVGPRPDRTSVTLVVYDAVQATNVHAGENSGRTLREGHIVRSADPVEIPSGGGVAINAALAPDQGAVLLVQDRDGSISGVAQVKPASETRI